MPQLDLYVVNYKPCLTAYYSIPVKYFQVNILLKDVFLFLRRKTGVFFIVRYPRCTDILVSLYNRRYALV